MAMPKSTTDTVHEYIDFAQQIKLKTNCCHTESVNIAISQGLLLTIKLLVKGPCCQ